MARGRFINKKISESERVNSLPDGAALLYTWMITHLDREGRIRGSAREIKRIVVPKRNFQVPTIDRWLDQMAAMKKNGVPLIQRYTVNGQQYIFMPGFDDEQGTSRRPGEIPYWKRHELPSELPPPPPLEGTAEQPPVPMDDFTDPVFKTMVKAYTDNIGIITPMIAERLQWIQDNFPAGWFEEAVKEAVLYGKRNLKYIERILENRKEGKKPPPAGRPPTGERELKWSDDE